MSVSFSLLICHSGHKYQGQGLVKVSSAILADRQSAWWTMDGGSWHCTGDRNQDHPHEKEMQKAKWLSGEALQIAEKRIEAKGKGEK